MWYQNTYLDFTTLCNEIKLEDFACHRLYILIKAML